MKAIDLFAGWGGFTEGATQAGVQVVWAANHWPLAVEAHAVNHPATTHVCQDLRQADWSALPRFDLLLASPACQGHSYASQPRRRPHHDAMRATAWAVVDCAEVTRPKALIVENVVPFQRWQLFGLWTAALERLGYTLDVREVTASKHGVPQRRTRLFVIGTRNGKRAAPLVEVPEPAFGPCIDLNAGTWRALDEMAPGARKRLAKGQATHGPRFFGQFVTGHPGVPLNEPIRTITGADQWIIVDGDRYRPLTVRETARAMSFPDRYAWPAHATRRDTIKGLGNAVCPEVVRQLVGVVADAA